MSLTDRSRILLRMLWNNKDLRVFLIHVLIGTLLQILARRCLKYMKDHPELFEETNKNRKKAKPRNRNKNKNPLVVPRGGAFVVPPKVFAFLKFLADSGFLVGIAGSAAAYVIKQIPLNAVSTYVVNSVRGSLPSTHGSLNKSVTTLDDVGKITLYECERIPDLEYLFDILRDLIIPFEEKERFTRLIFGRYFNLSTEEGRKAFVLCLLAILLTLSIYNHASYHILLKMLLEAIREGKIPNKLVRVIIRNFQRKGLRPGPELIEIAYSDLIE
jgi:hypothetical protein